jgi:hypothetical protein
MVGYGLVAVGLSVLFYFDPNTNTPAYSELKQLAFWIFVPYGILSVFVGWLHIRFDWDENQLTLPFSGKYFAAFQMPFAWAQLVAIPSTIWSSEIPGIIQWVVVVVAIIIVSHIVIFLAKNDMFEIPSLR